MNANLRSNAATKTTKRPRGFTLVELIVVIVIVCVLVAFLLPSVRRSREGARRSQCSNNLKQIALALLKYEDVYHALPPAYYRVDSDGKPLHSWRTLILPYLEQQSLYDKIDLTKAWNDPVNAESFKFRVETYVCPSSAIHNSANLTTYKAVLSSNSCIRPTEPRPLLEITDQHASTLLVVEMNFEHAVPWMTPRDAVDAQFVAINEQSETDHWGGVQAVFLDGHVRFLNATMSADVRRRLISIDDGNEPDEF
jgi:prepilin-type N-terminal cleavage/methylation domain-containing protein/prepilin-type processing-associated H-X9-DG protein